MPTLCANTTTLNRFPAGASAQQGKKKKKKKEVSQERLQKLWWAPTAATSPGVHSGSQLTHAGSCEARETLGLGTQALKPWGLKHQATDNDVLHQSLFSKPITEVGAQETWLYHPCLSGHSLFFLSAKAPDRSRRCSEERSGRLTH